MTINKMETSYWDDKLVIGSTLYILDKTAEYNKKYVDTQTEYIPGYIYRITVLKDCSADYVLDCAAYPHAYIFTLPHNIKFDGKIINWANKDIAFNCDIPKYIADRADEVHSTFIFGSHLRIIDGKHVS